MHPFINLMLGFAKNGANLQGVVSTIIQQNPQTAKLLEQAQRMAQGKNEHELQNFVVNYARENKIPEWIINKTKQYMNNPNQPVIQTIQENTLKENNL